MALPNLAPPKEEVKEPSSEVQELERLRQEKAELEARLREQAERDTQARLSEMEQRMREQYRSVRNAPQAPQPEPAYQAKEELGITDEEILANPSEAIRRISEHIAQQKIAEMQTQVSQVLGHQVRRGFDSEMAALQNDPDFKYLAGALQDYFESNPQEMVEAGAVRRRFYELVGANREYLAQMKAQEQAKKLVEEQQNAEQPGAVARSRVVEPSIPAGTPPVQTSPSGKEKSKELDNNPARAREKQRLIESFNQYGANLSEDEWLEIEEGRALPKKKSADIQMGYGGPNVEY